MGFWALPAVKVLAPILGGALLSKIGGGGGGSSAPNPQLAAQSQVETDLLKQQQQIIARLMEMAGNYTGGPIGKLDLPDSKYLDENFLGSLEPSRDIELLQSLLGRSVGSGATGALASLDQRESENRFNRSQDEGEAISGIIDSLITAFGNRQPQTETPPPPDTRATDTLYDFIGQPTQGGR